MEQQAMGHQVQPQVQGNNDNDLMSQILILGALNEDKIKTAKCEKRFVNIGSMALNITTLSEALAVSWAVRGKPAFFLSPLK